MLNNLYWRGCQPTAPSIHSSCAAIIARLPVMLARSPANAIGMSVEISSRSVPTAMRPQSRWLSTIGNTICAICQPTK